MQSEKRRSKPSTDGSSAAPVSSDDSPTSVSQDPEQQKRRNLWRIVEGGFIGLLLLYLFFADWGELTEVYLALVVALLLGMLIWAAFGELTTRLLLFIAVTSVVLCLFLVRVWLTVHFTWRMEDESRLNATPVAVGQSVAVAYPQMLLANATPVALQVMNYSLPSVSPLTVTFTADPQSYVVFTPLTSTLALSTPDSSTVVGTLLHTQYAPECNPLPEGQPLPLLLGWLEPPLRWVETALGGRCLSRPVTSTLTLIGDLSGGGVISTLPITFTLQAERPERASIRQFAANGESTNSPLLVLIPSAVALIGYLVVRRQDEEEKQRKGEQANKEKTEKQQKAEARWRQQLDYLMKREYSKAYEFKTLSVANEDPKWLSDGECKRQILDAADGTQQPSAEELANLFRKYPQETTQSIIAAAENCTIDRRSTYLNLARELLALRSKNAAAYNPATTEALRSLIARLETVPPFNHVEYIELTHDTLKPYQDGSVHRFKNALDGSNPFLYDSAEEENFGIWCDLSAYWSACPSNCSFTDCSAAGSAGDQQQARSGPLLVFGEAGSGKTALARADQARLLKGNPEPVGLWVRVQRKWDSAAALAAGSTALFDFIVKYPSYWLPMSPDQQQWLALYWLAHLPSGPMFKKLDRRKLELEKIKKEPKKPGVDTGQPDDQLAALRAMERVCQREQTRSPHLLPAAERAAGLALAAGQIGCRRVHIFVDDLAVTPSVREIELFHRWREQRAHVYLLTSDPGVAYATSQRGAPRMDVVWQPADLWRMGLHRFVQFASAPKNNQVGDEGRPHEADERELQDSYALPANFEPLGNNLPPQLEAWANSSPVNRLFDEKGWRAAIALTDIRTPRAMLRFWRALLAQPAKEQAKEQANERFTAEDVRQAAQDAARMTFS
jgi:hypothetical protein